MRGKDSTLLAITATLAWSEKAHGITAAATDMPSIHSSVSGVIFPPNHSDQHQPYVWVQPPFTYVAFDDPRCVVRLTIGVSIHVRLAVELG
jgi:hypothetical protein